MSSASDIPVVLFAYARTAHLARVLACLRENRVPVIHAFADGAKGESDHATVEETRALLRAIDWADVTLVERPENLGLGKNVVAGVTEVAARHEAFIVWEDDLVAVPGTYAWLCAALEHYRGHERVMSVTAWTHPRVTPADIGTQPYFDRRAECWVWGTWSRSWRGVPDETALQKMAAAQVRGVAPDAYGADLSEMARTEASRNIWAVRWLYHHLQHDGLCLRPPWSMVDHIGFDVSATNAPAAVGWDQPTLKPVPPIPAHWPEPLEHPQCRRQWRSAYPGGWRRLARRVRAKLA